ncbi:hypothetical protein RRG08_034755 [Elysia crispata]|uniref:Uncharacterized protein n=1 Tax=Elysia crispata TaxID=231223 RepID=A0AAE0YB88_9GAST|nr:hypothetical protein RRG08_034755 [Elysia crispata]
MVKSLTASLVSREEEERHQMNLNENEQLKKQIAEWTCSRPCHVSHLHRLCVHATHLRPVKRSRSTRYDGARQSSCMPWVWCGSSHNTLVIHWRIDAGREVLSDGCVRTTTSSEVPATRVLRQCGVG